MSSRSNQKQIWADEFFVRKLEEIKAKRLLAGKPVKNTGELTKMMCETDAFKQLEDEIMNFDPLEQTANHKRKTRLKIKFDGGLF